LLYNQVEQQVRIYKYVLIDKEGKSKEIDILKKSEAKHILIKKVERIIKENAIDCIVNYNNNVNKEEVEKYS